MPFYEYRCEKGHTFEVMQKMTDDPVTECEKCGRPVQRVFHPVAVHFKGSGFYNTDYGKRSRGRGGEEGDGGPPEGDRGKAGEGAATEGKNEGAKKPSGDSAKGSGGDSGSKAASSTAS